MDSKLAEIYKTEENLQTEAEALATLSMAQKLAAAEELNVDGMSDEDAEALAREVLAGEGDEEASQASASAEEGAEEETTEQEEGSVDEEAQEKVAEADHLGRVMAHAFVQERAKIAAAQVKTAAASKVEKGLAALGKHKKASAPAAKPVAPKAKVASKKKEAGEEDQVSALDQLALARAQEILKENGIEQEQEKTATMSEDQAAALQAKVEERAQALLIEAGYTFEESQTEEAEEKA